LKKIRRTDKVRNEVLQLGRKGISCMQLKAGKITELVTYCVGTAF